MGLIERLVKKYSEPEKLVWLLRWLWLISLGMLVLGYVLLFFLLFRGRF